MSSVLQRLRKRRAYPVAIGDDTVYVRALTTAEVDALLTFEGPTQIAFTLGCALVNDAGEPEFPRQSGESFADFAKRVLPEFADLPQDVLSVLSQGIDRVSKPANSEALKKSS